MPFTNFPNGITSLGMPTFGAGPFLPTGQVFFVSSLTGSTAYQGTTPAFPMPTIASALALCTLATNNQSNGTFIFVLPGHAETISAAAGINLNVAGVSIIGMGGGLQRPTITFATSTAATMTVTAANMTLANFNFVGNIAALVLAISVTAPGFQLQSCNFKNNTAATHILTTVLTSALATDMVINNCNFDYGTATTASTQAIELIGAARAQITNCYIGGAFNPTAIVGATTASIDVQLLSNTIVNTNNATIGFINMITGSTGNIANITGYTGYTTAGGIPTTITTVAATGVAISNCYATTGVAGKTAGAFLGVVST